VVFWRFVFDACDSLAFKETTIMSIDIRPMDIADLEAVTQLWNTTEGVGLNESDGPEQLRAFLERNPGLSLVAHDGSRLIGAVLCGDDGRRGFLYHLAVLPEYRKQGVGRAMVERCLDALGARGLRRCNILMYVDNHSGEQFWKRGGWYDRSELKLMQKDIPGSQRPEARGQ
jgi:ribosomal protein S18 acetylase RimI-like enzyme